MGDFILYRRFVILAAFIAAMGVIVANLVVETRTSQRADGWRPIGPGPAGKCAIQRVCGAPRIAYGGVLAG